MSDGGSAGQGTAWWGMGSAGLQAHLFCPSPSSSDAELDHGDSEASSVEPFDERPQQPELQLPPLLKPFTRHSSLREALPRAVSPHDLGEPEAEPGE